MLLKWEKWLREKFSWSNETIKKVKKCKCLPKKVKQHIKTIEWDETIFPESEILLNIKKGKKDNSVLYERYDTLDNLDVEEIADTLHQIDLKLYSRVLPTELVEYGKKDMYFSHKVNISDRAKENVVFPLHFQHILIKNKALKRVTTKKLQNGMKSTFFDRICQKLRQKRNYNSLQAISNGIKAFDETYTEFDSLELQNKQLEQSGEEKKLFILPFETIMDDIALSNQDPQSEEANMYFYGIIRFFIQLQDITPNIDEYLEHSLLKEMLTAINENKPVKYRTIKTGFAKFL